jgi:shikimate kinase
MGCGKTTVAQELARRLACSSIDLDTFITETQAARLLRSLKETESRIPFD